MHDYFEVGLRESIGIEAITDFISEFFPISKESIISEHDYWSEVWEGKERVGISIHFQESGLKTNVFGISYYVIDDATLDSFAKKAAVRFNSEVVIGDYRKCGPDFQDSCLSYFPDGSIWESVDISTGSINDVQLLHKVSM